MQTVQINVYGRDGVRLFFTLGMGMSYAAARASANVGMRARLDADRVMAGRVRLIEVEAV